MSQEKRQSGRSEVFLIAEYRPLNKPVEYSIGITDNFSAEGLSFETQDIDLKTGDILDLRLKSPRNGLLVTAVGEIAWRREGWYKCTLGVRFREIDEEAREKIFAFISGEEDAQYSAALTEDPSPPAAQQQEDAAAGDSAERDEKEQAEKGAMESVPAVQAERLQQESPLAEAEGQSDSEAVSHVLSENEKKEDAPPSGSDRKDEVNIADEKKKVHDAPGKGGKLEYSFTPRRRKRTKSRTSVRIAAAVLALAITVPAAIYIFDKKTENSVPSLFQEKTGEAEQAGQAAPVLGEPEREPLLLPQLSSPINLPPPLPEAIVPDDRESVPVKMQITDRKETVPGGPAAVIAPPEKERTPKDETKITVDNIIKRKSSRLETVTKKIESPVTIEPERTRPAPSKKEIPVQKAAPVQKTPAQEVVQEPRTDSEKKATASARAVVEQQERVTSAAPPLKKERPISPAAVIEGPEKRAGQENAVVKTPEIHKQILQTEQKEVLPSLPEEKQAILLKDKESSPEKPEPLIETGVVKTEEGTPPELPESVPVPEQKEIEKADQPVAKIDPPHVPVPEIKQETVVEKQPAVKKKRPSIGLVIRSRKK